MSDGNEEIENLLADIRSLLILGLSKQGFTSDQIGKCLGVGGSQVRNIMAGIRGKKRPQKRNR